MQNDLEKQKVQYLKSIAYYLQKISRELEKLNNKENDTFSDQKTVTEEYKKSLEL